MTKSALITGSAGQDGSYLAEHLLSLGYRVYGITRMQLRTTNTPHLVDGVSYFYGDMRDQLSLETAFMKANPDEVYNLAAQVFIPTSWQFPAETFDVNVGGLARLLQIVERRKPDCRVYQASSSEMYGNHGVRVNELSPFAPASPYGVSKLAAHQLCKVYRDKGLFVCSGILFNHESPRRGEEMVTRKITGAVARWAKGDTSKLKLGTLDSRRDWGFAGDYVRAMHLMLQREKPKDYVIATGMSYSVKDFIYTALDFAYAKTGDPALAGGILGKVELDQNFVRPNEILDLVGDSTAARSELGWKPAVEFPGLVRMMVEADLEK